MAQYSLGDLYENGIGVKADPLRAVLWYRQAANQEYPPAQHNLGYCYIKGKQIRRVQNLSEG